MSSGGSSGSTSTTQQSIAPELQPLFAQTGQQLQALQGFSPFGFQGQFPGFFPQAGGQPGGQPQVAQIPGLGTPTFAPAGLGTQVPGLTGGPALATPGGRTVEQIQAELNALPVEEGLRTGANLDREQTLQFELQQARANPPGAAQGIAPGGVGTFQPAPAQGGLPGTPLDEFLFPRPQQIPGFNPAQQSVLGRQGQRAFGSFISPQEQQAQQLAGGFGQLRFPEASALGLSQNFGGLRFPELLGLGQIGQFAGGEIGQSPATLAAMVSDF